MKKPDYESIGAIDALLGFALILIVWAAVLYGALWLAYAVVMEIVSSS